MTMSTAAAIAPETLRRVETHDDLATKKGFTFTEETLYAWGTEMAQSGKDEVRLRRGALETQPLVAGLLTQANAIAYKERRQDFSVTLPQLAMHPRFGTIVTKPGSNGAELSPWAFGQLLNRSDAPGGAAGYLKQVPPALRAPHVDHWMKSARTAKGEPKSAVLRTRLNEKGGRGIFAVVSEKYTRYDLFDAVRDIVAKVDPSGRAQLIYDGKKWRIRVTYMTPMEPVVGDIQHAFFDFWSSDDGSDSFHGGAGMFRIRCLNATLIPATVSVDPLRHTGKELGAKVQEMLTTLYGKVSEFADLWALAAKDSIIGGIYEDATPAAIFTALVGKGLVHVAGTEPGELVSRLVRAWEMEPGYTRASIVNAVTRAAHTETWRSAWDTMELEAQAGELLYNKLVLSPTEVADGAAKVSRLLEVE